MEQFNHAQKAKFAGDLVALQQVMEERRGRQYSNIKINNFDFKSWDAVREPILLNALTTKFTHNPYALEKLRSTGSAKIVCAGTHNRLVSTGLDLKDPKNVDPEQWCGKNELGIMLMQVRSVLC